MSDQKEPEVDVTSLIKGDEEVDVNSLIKKKLPTSSETTSEDSTTTSESTFQSPSQSESPSGLKTGNAAQTLDAQGNSPAATKIETNTLSDPYGQKSAASAQALKNYTEQKVLVDHINKNPQDSDAKYNFASVLTKQGKYPQASNLYTGLIAENPDDPKNYYGMYYTLTKQGRDQEAKEYYDKWKELTPAPKETDGLPDNSNLGKDGLPKQQEEHQKEIDDQYYKPYREEMGNVLTALEQLPVISTAKQSIEGIKETVKSFGEAADAFEVNNLPTGFLKAAEGGLHAFMTAGAATPEGAMFFETLNTTKLLGVPEEVTNAVMSPVTSVLDQVGIKPEGDAKSVTNFLDFAATILMMHRMGKPFSKMGEVTKPDWVKAQEDITKNPPTKSEVAAVLNNAGNPEAAKTQKDLLDLSEAASKDETLAPLIQDKYKQLNERLVAQTKQAAEQEAQAKDVEEKKQQIAALEEKKVGQEPAVQQGIDEQILGLQEEVKAVEPTTPKMGDEGLKVEDQLAKEDSELTPQEEATFTQMQKLFTPKEGLFEGKVDWERFYKQLEAGDFDKTEGIEGLKRKLPLLYDKTTGERLKQEVPLEKKPEITEKEKSAEPPSEPLERKGKTPEELISDIDTRIAKHEEEIKNQQEGKPDRTEEITATINNLKSMREEIVSEQKSKDVGNDLGNGIKNKVVAEDVHVLPISEIEKLRTQDKREGGLMQETYNNELEKGFENEGVKEPLQIIYYPEEGKAILSDGHTKLDVAKGMDMERMPVRITEKSGDAPRNAKDFTPPKDYFKKKEVGQSAQVKIEEMPKDNKNYIRNEDGTLEEAKGSRDFSNRHGLDLFINKEETAIYDKKTGIIVGDGENLHEAQADLEARVERNGIDKMKQRLAEMAGEKEVKEPKEVKPKVKKETSPKGKASESKGQSKEDKGIPSKENTKVEKKSEPVKEAVVKNGFTGGEEFYHGTNKQFDKFEKQSKAGQENTVTEQPIFLAEDKGMADANAKGSGARTLSVKVKGGKFFDFRKDLFTNGKGEFGDYDKLYNSLSAVGKKIFDAIDSGEIDLSKTRFSDYDGYDVIAKKLTTGDYDFIEIKPFKEWLEKNGYDGTFLKEHPSEKSANLAVWNTDKLEISNTPVTDAVKPKKGKDLIAEGADELARALGIIKNITGDKKPDAVKALVKIGRGLIDEGLATAENVWEKVKEYFKDKHSHDISDEFKDSVEKEFKKKEDKDIAGISHRVLQQVGMDTTPAEGWTPEVAHQIGKGLLTELRTNGIDPETLLDEKDKSLEPEEKVALRAAMNTELSKAKYEAGDKFGIDSKEYKEADKKQKKFLEDTKYLGGKAQKAMVAFQGQTDLNTDLFSSASYIADAAKKDAGRELNEMELKKAKEIADRVKKYQEDKDYVEKITKAHESGDSKKSYTERAKSAADSFRKLKTKPFVFKDSNGNEIQVHTMGITWNDAVEAGAKVIEATGKVADAVVAAIEKIKDADWYGKLSEEDKKRFAQQLEDHYESQQKPLAEQFVDKTDNVFTPQEARDVWAHTKTYIKQGKSLGEAVHRAGDDLGLSNEQVLHAITTPKNAKQFVDAEYLRQRKLRDAQSEAKAWVNSRKYSPLKRAVMKFVNFEFAKTVFGHGTVSLFTHGGTLALDPRFAKQFWGTFLKQYKLFVSNDADFEKFIDEFQRDPLFAKKLKAGLKIDPNDVKTDEYFLSGTNKENIFSKIARQGNKGFFGIKIIRSKRFDFYYDKLTDAEKTDPKALESIADLANHETGTVGGDWGRGGQIAATVAFAPKLEASRWMGGIVDPVKTFNTFTHWKTATTAEKVFAKQQARSMGAKVATYAGALAVNQALLSLSGSKQKLNYIDPTQSDFLALKAGGHTIGVTSGVLSTYHFIGSMLATSMGAFKEQSGFKDSPSDKAKKALVTQLRYKMSPVLNQIVDLAWGEDIMGRPLPSPYHVKPKFKDVVPYGKGREVSAAAKKIGKTTTGWTEYVLTQQMPIPVADGIKTTLESMKNSGVTKAQAKDIFSGAMSFFITGGTGIRYLPDYSLEKK